MKTEIWQSVFLFDKSDDFVNDAVAGGGGGGGAASGSRR